MALFVRRRWPKVLAAVGVLGAIVLVVVLLTRDSSPSVRPGARPGDPDIVQTADPVPDPTLPSVALSTVLAASDTEIKTFAEQTVSGNDVPVLGLVGPSAIWIGDSPEHRVLLVMVGTAQTFDGVEVGARLSFDGVVRRTARGFGRALGLRGADATAFDRQGTYVEVEAYRKD
jgi:hypothetical protein